ncbi:hypothetical protein CAPTEDRAFT_227211 [Capitella teleta]|uniref:Transmembrane protein 243 n=1 Tax=Capitella teleta TaxID=283909 RepID=R7T8M6_CAPTE|nr:hypothetical protein CAPTEDRAFT_227211 [Capitella teleta]|eukprot:ELT87745.1 hypothetical protein CAPTEDRAFT_227211 [Capitella teleta]
MAAYQALDAQGPAPTVPDPKEDTMEHCRSSRYAPHPYYDDPAGKPLFGDARPSDRVLNLIVGTFTSLFVTVTVISAIAFPSWPPRGINVYFAFCITVICGSHLTLIYWYRQGDLEPRFRKLIYCNAVSLILLCLCANLYIHNVG